MAEKNKGYIRNPFPKIWTQDDLTDNVFATDTPYELKYLNVDYETSEIKKLLLRCAPLVQITVERDNQAGTKTMVHETVYAHEVNYCIYFKDKATDKTLTLGRGKKIYVTINHAYGSNQMFTFILDKDQLLWKPSAKGAKS